MKDQVGKSGEWKGLSFFWLFTGSFGCTGLVI